MALDMKAFLDRMANEVTPSPAPQPDTFRRVVRRRIRNATAIAVAVGLIVFGSIAGVRSLTRPAPILPAQSRSCSWEVVSSPNHDPSTYYNVLRKVAVISSDDAWAIGWYSLGGEGSPAPSVILHWDGANWNSVSHPEPGTDSQLYDLAAVSSNDVWAVGSGSDSTGNGPHGLIEHWDGSAWSVVPVADPGTAFWHFEGVAATGPDDAWAVGNTATGHSGGTLTEHWDGTAWTIMPSPSPSPRPLVGEPYPGLDAVTAISSDDVWAVGETTNVAPAGPSNTLVEHWDGSTWSVAPSPDVTNDTGEAFDHLFSVAANSPSDVWAVGSHGDGPGIGGDGDHALVEHWDGASWRVVAVPHPGAPDGFSAVATSGDEVWAVGAYGSGGTQEALIERWDGNAWSIVENPAGPGTALSGVAGLPSGDAWAVGWHARDTLTLRCD